MPEAAIRIAIRQTRYTNGVAAPEKGMENCGLKNVETAGPMIAADMITAPTGPTTFLRRPARGVCLLLVILPPGAVWIDAQHRPSAVSRSTARRARSVAARSAAGAFGATV